MWSSGCHGAHPVDHADLELKVIPLTLSPKCGFTFNSQEEHQEMRAISEVSGFAIEASRVESPWPWAEVSLGPLWSRNPDRRRVVVLGLGVQPSSLPCHLCGLTKSTPKWP